MEFKRFDGEPTEDFKQRITTDLKLIGWSGADITEMLEGLPDYVMTLTLNVTDNRYPADSYDFEIVI